MPDEIRQYVIYVVSSRTHCFALPVIHESKLRNCHILEYALCTEREAMEKARKFEKELGLPGDRRFEPEQRIQTTEATKKWKKRK